MVVRYVEQFLGGFEAKVFPQTTGFGQKFLRAPQPKFETQFSKIGFLSLFLAHVLIGVSHDPNFFYQRKEPSLGTF